MLEALNQEQQNNIVLFRSSLLSGEGHPSKPYMSNAKVEGSKKKGEAEFEAWWSNLIKQEPSFAEYVKVKRVCKEAFLAGLFRDEDERAA